MTIGIDIGGTKTLLAVFTKDGRILRQQRFETPKNYDDFIAQLQKAGTKLTTEKDARCCVAVPGLLDRRSGVEIALGNLPWQDKQIRLDVGRALNTQHVVIENDSKLAGLAEASALKQAYPRVFYLTFSTGIGGALLVNGKLSHDVISMEIGKVPLPHGKRLEQWEEFASGRAFLARYGKKAADVTDPVIWEEFAQEIGIGISMVCSIFQVDAIVFGGGLGQHLDRFSQYLEPFTTTYLHPIVKQPKALLKTAYKDDAVIYGCYHYAQDHLS